MADPSTEKTPRRRNATVSVAEALGGVIDPVLRKRGFASRDLVAHWQVIAPAPYGALSVPDKLVWPRNAEGAGATLWLRAAPGHGLALTHEADRIAQTVNRYFGYVLVRSVRLSPDPFTPGSAALGENHDKPSDRTQTTVDDTIAHVKDDGLREALRTLGHALLGRSEGKGP
jgi:hypothetical protein